jgi:hypothetical protein
MNPIMKYSLARLLLFVAVAAVLFVIPVDIDPLVKLLIALLVSAAGSFFLMRRWRDDVADRLAANMSRRQREKEKLRAALNGEDEPPAR